MEAENTEEPFTPDYLTEFPLMSREIDKISLALTVVEKELGHAAKDSKNPFFKSYYADLSSVIDAIRPTLAKEGIKILQPLLHSDEQGVRVQTVLLHSSGQWIADGGPVMPVNKNDAQGHGSAITYARRYGLAALVGITQADDDGNNATKAAPVKRSSTAPPGRVMSELQRGERR